MTTDPTHPRVRVVHKLFLLLALTIALALLLLGGATVHHLRRGFIAYVNTLDLAKLQPLASDLEARTDADDGFEGLREPQRWQTLLRQELAPPFPGPATARKGSAFAPPPPPPPPPPPMHEDHGSTQAPLPLAPRVSLLDSAQRVVAGPSPPANALRLPLRRGGRVLGWLALRPLAHPVDSRDTEFLANQIHNMVTLGGLLLLFAVGVAWIFARYLLAPLRDVERLARRLSEGQYGLALRTRRHDELGDLVRHVNHLSHALAAHETARQRWIADISHELRTPLTIVRGELEAMREGVRPIDIGGLDSLHQEVMRLDRLVDDLHQWSMADIGSLSYRPQPVDMQVLLQDTCARFDAAATSAGLQLSCDAEKLSVLGDPDRLRQLIDNLISNSLNYSTRGGRIDMILVEDAGRARVRVDDTPPGVDSSELGRLFDPLYRGEASRNRQHGGSGLGLAIAQRIAVAHGGELGAMPSPLGGLRIELWLPLEHP